MTSQALWVMSSPSNSRVVLKKIAAANRTGSSTATVKTVKNNFYVDDRLKSSSSVTELSTIVDEIRPLLASRGFRLTKFVNNCSQVLNSVPLVNHAHISPSLYL